MISNSYLKLMQSIPSSSLTFPCGAATIMVITMSSFVWQYFKRKIYYLCFIFHPDETLLLDVVCVCVSAWRHAMNCNPNHQSLLCCRRFHRRNGCRIRTNDIKENIQFGRFGRTFHHVLFGFQFRR